MLKHDVVELIALPFTRNEVPGWGSIYSLVVGGHRRQEFWKEGSPKIIRDKRCGYYKILNISEWADRSLFFLGRWYDLKTQLLVESLVSPGDKVLDIGANYGHFSMAAAKAVGPNGQVVSFEPNPTAFSRLMVHLDINNLHWVHGMNFGIADVRSTMRLSIPGINSGEATFAASPYDDVCIHEVPVWRLDDIDIASEANLMKIDVEGFEVNVLRGANTLIHKARPYIIMEVVEAHLNRSGVGRDILVSTMNGLGYRIYDLKLLGWGPRQRLKVSRIQSIVADGDYLFVPEERAVNISHLHQ